MKAWLIPEARKAWRMLTMHLALAAVLFGGLSAEHQAQLLELVGLPPERVPLVLGLLLGVLRLVRQPAVAGDKPAEG